MKALSILVVEDEAIIAEDLRSRLTKLGYAVIDTVATGNQAVAVATMVKPDLVLMDIQLRGEMNGIEAASQIRQVVDSPIIYLSSHTDHKTVDAATLTEPAGYLLKPIDDRELKITLQMAAFQHFTQREIGRMERWMATTLSSIGEGLISTDAAGRIFYMNSRAETLTGWRTGEAVGRDLEEVFATRDAETGQPIVNTVHNAMRNGDTLYTNHRIMLCRQNDEDIYIQQSASPIRDGDGHMIGVVLVFRDCTESVRAQDALRESESRLRDACRVRDHFFSVLSHELRTPLTPVMLLLSSLLGDTSLPEHIRADIEVCLAHTKQEANLVDDLLDVNRMLSGQLLLERKQVDLHAILRQAVSACARRDGIEVQLQLNADTHFVLGDEPRLRQLFSNLLINAHKFTASGGQIAVRTHHADDRNVGVEISDTGCGISAELLPRLFRAFEQSGPGTNRQFGGLGLGLAIAKAITDAHQGTIVAQSDGVDRGSSFNVTLPTCVPDSSEIDRAKPDAASDAGPFSILLVEDHEPSLQILSRLLRDAGHTVHAALNQADALAAAQNQSFDLLVTDIGLPDGNGCDLLKQIQALQPLPAIALTGFGGTDDIHQTREAGFCHHLTKPVVVEELLAAMESAKGGR
jgi:PAS domain S-box-containing protein